MIIYSKNLIVSTEDFPAISIIRSNVNYDKYSVVFQSKFDADANVSISGLLEKITEGITNNKLYLKIEN